MRHFRHAHLGILFGIQPHEQHAFHADARDKADARAFMAPSFLPQQAISAPPVAVKMLPHAGQV